MGDQIGRRFLFVDVQQAPLERLTPMAKQLLFDEDGRHALKKGSDMLAEAVKLTRSALQNAASIAAMILKTDSLITDVPEKEQPAFPAMPEY